MRLVVPIAVLAATLILAAPAPARDNGEGLIGETDDKIVTFFSLGVIVFFVLVVVLGSALQQLLEKRKEERKAVELRRRVGW
jgi:nitrogen fixation/metabolism regulation signal transduction histidine kinase